MSAYVGFHGKYRMIVIIVLNFIDFPKYFHISIYYSNAINKLVKCN